MLRYVIAQNRYIFYIAAAIIAVFYVLVFATPLEASSAVNVVRPAVSGIIAVGCTQWLRSRAESHDDRFMLTMPISRRQLISTNFAVTLVALLVMCFALSIDGFMVALIFAASLMIAIGLLQATVLRFGKAASLIIIVGVLVLMGVLALIVKLFPDTTNAIDWLQAHPSAFLIFGSAVYAACWAWAVRVYQRMDV